MMSQHKDASNTRIKEQISMGDIVMGVCYRLPDQEEQADEAPSDRQEQPPVHRPCPHGGL